MWFTRKRFTTRRFTRKHVTTAQPAREAPVGCPHVLVLHADGTRRCEHEHACGADELLHEWWVACDELRCGCAGDEHDLVLCWAEAA